MSRIHKHIVVNSRTYEVRVLPDADAKGIHVVAQEGKKTVLDMFVAVEDATAAEKFIDEVIALMERQLLQGGSPLQGEREPSVHVGKSS